MRIVCPSCCESFPIECGFADIDGKKLSALFADMEPVLGRAVLGYLRLFKPAKKQMRTVRAVRVIEELLVLVRPGSVCRDERGGLRRPAPQAIWAAAIEQMLAVPEKLQLPLSNHHYLRAIVYGLADQADATRERARDTELRTKREAPRAESSLQAELAYLVNQFQLGVISKDECEQRSAAARAKSTGDRL